MRTRIQKTIILLCGLMVSAMALAQAPATPERAMTYEMAVKAMDAAEAEAHANNWTLTIVVADAEGIPVLLRRMNGASSRSYEIAMGKARTVVATGMTSGEYGTKLAAGEIKAIENGITFAGGVPVMHNGVLIGAVTASGARGIEDEQVSKAGAAAIDD